jgi:tRNA threonylcarbamoyladenosine biosynthesis protein TsaE
LIRLSTKDETRALGEALAAVLRAGDLVVLAGPLGAGKTVLAQGIGAGLRVIGPVLSPTFVIARVHRPDPAAGGTLPLVHVDAYRLGTAADPRAQLDDLDLEAALEETVTVVEWGEGMVEHLTDAYLLVRIDRAGAAAGSGQPAGGSAADPLDPDGVRLAQLAGHGGDWPQRLAGLLPAVGCTRAGAGD